VNKKYVFLSFIFFLFFIPLFPGSLFAREKHGGSKKNTLFFGPVTAGYERSLNRSFSIGVESGLDFAGLRNVDTTVAESMVFVSSFNDLFVRWYPWQRSFFINLGAGYEHGGLETEKDKTSVFLYLKPQVGWKIDIGRAGGWIFETRLGFGLGVNDEDILRTLAFPILLGIHF
jgi:hypothetical protein